jgi:methylenetetrahydrofolate dehydrogenase (NADP+)/methenyltetrahydrofolate cyclohydrolase
MTAQILDGKKLSVTIRADLKAQMAALAKAGKPAPGLAVVLVGDDPASQVYVRNKREACNEIGMQSFAYDLANDVSQQDLLKLIDQLNQDSKVNGILIQLPLPAQIDTQTILERVDPKKDVDGFHPYNLGRLAQGQPLLRPCTPYGIIKLLAEYKINLSGLNAVVVGASNIVGRPMALELLTEDCTVTICHSKTKDLAQHISCADLLVAAIGHPGVIKSEWLKPGVIVVDVGMNRLDDGRLVGDIDFDSAKQKASWITPVPGGVGPMTVATLLQNTYYSYSLK